MTSLYEARTSTGAHHDGAFEREMELLRDCNREGRFDEIDPIILRVLGRKKPFPSLDAMCAALVEKSDLPVTVTARCLVALAERELKTRGYDAGRSVAKAAHQALARSGLAATDSRMYRIEAGAALSEGCPDVARDIMRHAEDRVGSIEAADDLTIRQRAELENSNVLALIELEEGRVLEARAVLAPTLPFRTNTNIDAWNRIEHELLESLAMYESDPRGASAVFARAVVELEASGARYERAKYALLWGRYAGDVAETERGIETFERIGVSRLALRERQRIADAAMRRARVTRVDKSVLEALMPDGFPIASDEWHEILSNLYKQLAGGNFEFTLVLGPTGAGKSAVVRFIHNALAALHGRRADLFAEHNCATDASGDTTVHETVLFGQEEKTFSQVAGKRGKLEAASGGTLFLDEIGVTGVELQRRLLKVIEDRRVSRVGSTSLKPPIVDVAIVAATNKDPNELVATGEWQADFAARVTRSVVTLPPLTRSAVAPFAAFFKNKCLRTFGRRALNMHIDAYDYLESQPWPKNLRGLEATITSAIASLPPDADALTVDDLMSGSRYEVSPSAASADRATVRIEMSPDDCIEIPRERLNPEFITVLRELASDTPTFAAWDPIWKAVRQMIVDHFVAKYPFERAAARAFGTPHMTFKAYVRRADGDRR